MTAFERVGETTFYIAGDTSPADARLGFLLLKPDAPPDRIALADALTNPDGVFVFVPGLPQGRALQRFLDAAGDFLSRPGRAGARFAWFPHLETTPLDGQVLRARASDSSLTTEDRVDFDFANVAVRLVKGNTVQLDEPGTGLAFAPPEGGGNAILVTPRGVGARATYAIEGPVGLALLGGDGPRGAFRFTYDVGTQGLEDFDVGQRYFMTSMDAPGYVDSLRYPILDLRAPEAKLKALGAGDDDPTTLTFTAAFDPVDQLAEDRTYIALDGAAKGPVRAYYRNPLGQVMHLTPTASAKLVFQPFLTTEPGDDDAAAAGNEPYYLTPAGDFALEQRASAVAGDDAAAYTRYLMCGTSGVEYIGLAPAGKTTTLRFRANQPAYAQADYSFDKGRLTGVKFGELRATGRTAWCYVAGDGYDLGYYAQPDTAILHGGDGGTRAAADSGGGGASFLPYLPLQSGTLPADGSAVAESADSVFPLVPYAGIEGDSLVRFRDLELQVLGPSRRRRIGGNGAKSAASEAARHRSGTTRQGLLLDLANGGWSSLTLGQSALADGGESPLQLHHVTGELKTALQSNHVFLVASDARKLLQYCSVTYKLTATVRDALAKRAKVPEAIVDKLAGLDGKTYDSLAAYETAVLTALAPYELTQDALKRLEAAEDPPQDVVAALSDKIAGNSYDTFDAIDKALRDALSASAYRDWHLVAIGYAVKDYPTYARVIETYAADAKLVIQGWTFDLSPYQWSNFGTVLILKFADKPLEELVADTGAWSSPESFNADPSSAQQRIQAIIRQARARKDPDLDYFLDTVVADPNWNGILALDTRVPLSGLPDALKSLAAGIDPAEFKAHHVGVNLTPVRVGSDGKLSAKPSSLFGLINYESPEDPPDKQDESTPYQFRVLSLKVLMANTAIADFSSQVELLVNRLFGDGVNLRGENSNKVLFNGYYQKHGANGQGSYSFVTDTSYVFDSTGNVLDTIRVAGARFFTVQDENETGDDTVNAVFRFEGRLAFKALPGFDLFSFGGDDDGSRDGDGNGGLSFGNLAVRMSFPAPTPSYKTFSFDAGGIALDLATSGARSGSLYAHFPLKLTALVQGTANNRPDKKGYLPVATPLAGAGLGDAWYGLTFDLNLGSPGALAAKVGFTATVVAAWSPGGDTPKLFVGLALPGAKGGERALTVEGVIKIAFGDIRFVAAGTSYMLQLRNMALKILSLSLPPTGQTNVLLFGDPDGKDRETLGWYAAYQKPDDRKKKKDAEKEQEQLRGPRG